MKKLGVVLVLTAIFFNVGPRSVEAAVAPSALIELTNEKRALNNLFPLKESETLNRAAQMKAEDMAKKGYFAHTSPEGRDPWYWFGKAGYIYTEAGENLAVGYSRTESVIRAWLNSPGHKANLLGKKYTEVGVGIAKGVYRGRNTTFVVELYGTPLPTNSRSAYVETPVWIPMFDPRLVYPYNLSWNVAV